MIITEYVLNAFNPKTNEFYTLGTFIDEEEAWLHILDLNWDATAVKTDWFFQVIEKE